MPSRADMIAFLQSQQAPTAAQASETDSSDQSPAALMAMSSDQMMDQARKNMTGEDKPKTRAEKIAFIQAQKDGPKSDPAQAAIEHFGQGATLGYLPQLQAGAEKIMDPILNKITGNNVQPDDYVTARDANIQRLAKEAKDNPKIAKAAEIAGGLTSGIAAAPLLPEAGAASTVAGKIAQGAVQGAKTGAVYGAVSNPGDTAGVVDPLQLGDRAANAAKGAGTGLAVGAAVPAAIAGVQVGAKVVRGAAADALESLAEKSAVNATGATGKQASTFDDNAGRELLDRGIVRFGDNQEKIASRASQAVDAANDSIDTALKTLDAKGVKVDVNDIYNNVRAKITQLKGDPSQADVAKILESELDNLISATDAKGSTLLTPSEAEQIKRGYNRKAGNWADPEKSQAGKTMYQAMRSGVEDAAQAADPETAQLFAEGKKSYGLLTPIQEAAERRASTTSQSPAGGLADIASAGAGFLKGGPAGAIAAPIARRVIAPRVASTIAVTTDNLSKALRQIPEMANLEIKQPGVFQAIVSHAASNGGVAPAQSANIQKKGPDKWANDGAQNLLKHDPTSLDGFTQADLKDPKTKDLLIQASDLKPGSKGMAKVMTQIKQTQKQED